LLEPPADSRLKDWAQAMSIRVGIVQINVTDLLRAWEFYVETLGIRGKWPLGPGKAFELELEVGSPMVLVYPVDRMAQSNYPHGTGVTLVFYTDNIEHTFTEWYSKGVNFISIAWSQDARGMAETPFGTFIAFSDPFGNVHELLEPR
jgi:predicted enzyme related to lactoylglutathione lyase